MRQRYFGQTVLAAVVAAVLCFPGTTWAHRVNVFAYVEGGTVHVECSYSKSDRVRFGDIEVKNPASGKVYLTGKTDEKGNFAFAVPPEAKAAKADLLILLKAGEGHQNDWTVKADEYLGAAPATEAREQSAAPVPATSQPAAAEPALSAAPIAASGVAAAQPMPTTTMDAAALQAIVTSAVDAAVEKKIAPVRRMLLDQAEKGPGMREIFGGIGYLVGIAGLLAYVRCRKDRPRA